MSSETILLKLRKREKTLEETSWERYSSTFESSLKTCQKQTISWKCGSVSSRILALASMRNQLQIFSAKFWSKKTRRFYIWSNSRMASTKRKNSSRQRKICLRINWQTWNKIWMITPGKTNSKKKKFGPTTTTRRATGALRKGIGQSARRCQRKETGVGNGRRLQRKRIEFLDTRIFFPNKVDD